MNSTTINSKPQMMAQLMQFSRRGMFERVFPSPYSSRYRKFFETEVSISKFEKQS